MLEWYRANEPYDVLMDDCAALLAEMARAAGAKEFRFRGKTINPLAEPERVTVAEAFARHAGVNLLGTIQGGRGDSKALAAAAAKAGVATAADDSWIDIFSRISQSAWRGTSASLGPPYYMSTLCRWPR